MRIAILGAGATGGFWPGRWQRSGMTYLCLSVGRIWQQ